MYQYVCLGQIFEVYNLLVTTRDQAFPALLHPSQLLERGELLRARGLAERMEPRVRVREEHRRLVVLDDPALVEQHHLCARRVSTFLQQTDARCWNDTNPVVVDDRPETVRDREDRALGELPVAGRGESAAT